MAFQAGREQVRLSKAKRGRGWGRGERGSGWWWVVGKQVFKKLSLEAGAYLIGLEHMS